MNSDAPEEGNAFWAQKSALEQVCPSSSRQLLAQLTIRMHTTLLVFVVQMSSGRTSRREGSVAAKEALTRADASVC